MGTYIFSSVELPYLAIHLEENKSGIPISSYQGWPYYLTACEWHVENTAMWKELGSAASVQHKFQTDCSLKCKKIKQVSRKIRKCLYGLVSRESMEGKRSMKKKTYVFDFIEIKHFIWQRYYKVKNINDRLGKNIHV